MTILRMMLAGLCTIQSIRLPAREKTVPAPLALSMQDAIRLALSPQGNGEIAVAGESVHAAEARFRQTRAAALPDVAATVGGQNQVLNLSALGFESIHLPVSDFSFPRSVGPFNTVDARMHVRQSVYDVASTRRSQASRAALETAKDETTEVRDRIAGQVAQLYLAAVRAAAQIEVAQATLAFSESSLEEVSNRNAAGKALGIDVSRARTRVVSNKQKLLAARMERSRVLLDLLSALNRDLDTPLELTDSLADTPVDKVQPEDALAIALKSRAEVVAQRQRVEAARLNDISIHAERYPSLAGYADMGSLGTTIANSVGTYTVGVSLRIPVFDGGRRDARRQEIQSLMRQEQLRLSQLEKHVELEVRQAMLKLEIARAQIETTTEEVELARQEIEHRRRTYEQGSGERMALAEAQLKLAEASDNRTAALYAWNEGRIKLMQAMGTIRDLRIEIRHGLRLCRAHLECGPLSRRAHIAGRNY